MSALTFETLSTELTQALAEHSMTPPKTVARCTLGRDKVMVLVEYPLDSANAEPLAHQTLDWLEQHLRSRFNTTGLPDEVADLSESAEQVAVQIYLKHISEAKPFTMRSFIWKVGDSFDELFGDVDSAALLADAALAEEDKTDETLADESLVDSPLSDGLTAQTGVLSEAPAERNGHNAAESETDLDSDAGFFSISPVPMESAMLPEGEEERVLKELEEDSLSLDLESGLDLGDDLKLGLDSELSTDFGADLESASPAILNAASSAEADSALAADFGLNLDAPSDSSQSAAPSPDLSPDLLLDLGSGLAPETDFVPDLSINSGSDLDADLSVGVNTTQLSDYPSTDFTLPGEAPTIESADFDLPTVDLPIVTPKVEEEGSTDFFSLVDDPELPEATDSETTNLLETELEAGLTFGTEPQDTLAEVSTGQKEVTEEAVAEEAAVEKEAVEKEPIPKEPVQEELVKEEPATEEPTKIEEPNKLDPVIAAIETAVIEKTVLEDPLSDSLPANEPAPTTDSEALRADANELLGRDTLTEEALTEAALTEAALTEETLAEEALTEETLAEEREETDLEEVDLSVDSPEDDPLADDDLVPNDLTEFSLDTSQMAEQATVEASLVEASLTDTEQNETSKPIAGSGAFLDGLSLVDVSLDATEDEAEGTDVTESLLLTDDDTDQSPAEAEYESTGYALTESGNEDEEYETEEYEYEYEEVTHDHEEYADDPVYYLEDDGSRDEEDAFEDYEEAVASVDETEVQRQRELWQQQTKSSNPMVIIGILGFLFAGVVGFFITRPCTIGRCDRIEAAQVKGDEAINNLRTDSTLDAVTASKKELKESILLLDPIPPWSGHYDEAQAILPEYERQLSALDLVTEAQGKAYSAAVKSQNPPHSVATWQEIASEWREATRALSAVHEDSPVRELANRKLAEYRSNLSNILVRIESESGAEVSLRQAQQAASRATQQTPVADSAEAWEAVLSDWETAAENLRRIPQGTSAYAEAQQMLPEIEAALQEVRSRAEQERSASRLLFRAQQLGTDAQAAEEDELWTTAVEHWNLAVIQLKDIPEGVFAHSTAQSLLTTYTGALSAAENNLEVSLRFQPVEPSFYLICGLSDVQKCSYSLAAGKVRMDLLEGYDSVINESITPPPERTGLDTDAQLVSQSNRLLQQITLLSTQAQIPIELYDAKGDFLARYQPDLDGFVRQ